MHRRQETRNVAQPARDVMEARWFALPWLDVADIESRREVLIELLRAYGAPDRHYHSLTHVADLLSLSAVYSDRLARPNIVDLAIFFHDAVYDATRRDNEAASAGLARERLTRLGLALGDVNEVARFIDATAHGNAALSSPLGDLAWFLDFDLSVLGAARETYVRYAAAIRREYAIYSDDVYARGRRSALDGFLSRPSIFTTREFRDRWEACARSNVAWELSVQTLSG